MLVNFFRSALNLKKVPRQGWIEKLSITNPESVADHTYSMAVMGMAVSDLAGMDSEKVLKMILLHDLAESITGDFTPEKISRKEKKRLEGDAFEKILQDLPTSLCSQYREIWDEYQQNTTAESKIVHQVDRLEMALQAMSYQREGGIHQKEISVFLESAKKDITDPGLIKLFKQITGDEQHV